MNRLGIKAKPVFIGFNLINQVSRLIEVVPIETINKDEAVYNTGRYLSAEFNIGPGFTPFDRSHMGFVDAHNPVINSMTFAIIHALLLPVQFGDYQ
jgi:hypothetical protein